MGVPEGRAVSAPEMLWLASAVREQEAKRWRRAYYLMSLVSYALGAAIGFVAGFVAAGGHL